ncbi:hypothetical protein [Streptomyces albogriseolus]|uniref:hypothetical protein n=1 Tax=Streptomyces albogriseolus TaxID=1887 RepID=UPI002254071A|nr:hypothetical protein [Streptomyces viridodiastaticus]
MPPDLQGYGAGATGNRAKVGLPVVPNRAHELEDHRETGKRARQKSSTGKVDLPSGKVKVTSEQPLDPAAVAAAVDEARYELVGGESR